MFTYVSIAIVLLTAVWAGIDSRLFQIPSGKKAYTIGASISWFVCCLGLWIIAFPVYLYKRARTLKEREVPSSKSTWVTVAGVLVITAELVCIAAPFLGWQRLSVATLRDRVSASIQSTWAGNPKTKDVHLKSFSLTRRGGDDYDGLVVAEIAGKEFNYNADVTYDGKMFRWKLRQAKSSTPADRAR